jgi:hypothetical protein
VKPNQLGRMIRAADRDSLRFSNSERELIRTLADLSLNGNERRIVNVQSTNTSEWVEINFSKFVADSNGENAVVFISQYFTDDSLAQIHGGWEQINFYERKDSTWTLRKQKRLVEY